MGHDLTQVNKRVFVIEPAALLSQLLPFNPKNRIGRLLRTKPDAYRVAFEFCELHPAVSEPFVAHPVSLAA